MNSEQHVNPLFQAALEFQEYFKIKDWEFCFFGGLAVLRWGEMRMTQDVDLCLLCGFGSEVPFINALLKDFEPRIAGAHEFAIQNRVILLFASNGVSIDISLSGIPFEEAMIRRATYFEFYPHCSLLTCSAEDLVVLKTFADRPKDWMDIDGIIIRQINVLDQSYIIDQLAPLCRAKGTLELIAKLQALFEYNKNRGC
jgi:hypothetical protein